MDDAVLKIAICDDDEMVVARMEKWLQDYFKIYQMPKPQLDRYYSGEAMLDCGINYDIVMLDIEMPGMNGIYIGRELMHRNSACLIFVITSYGEYIDDALRFRAFRYLTKPLDQGRLYRNLKDAIKIYTTSTTKIAIETKHEVVTVKAPDIIYFESQAHKLIAHTKYGDYVCVKNMNDWEKSLNMNYFFRVHRSFIVNMEHIVRFDNTLVYMDNDQTAYLTKRKYHEFKRAYMMYLEGENR